MARTSHKNIKKTIYSASKSISDKEFFTGRAFRAYLTDIAENTTRRYAYDKKLRVIVIWDESEDAEVASTDNYSIRINAGSEFVLSYTSRESRYYVIIGLMMHEVGHMLYTDFQLNKKLTRDLLKRKTLLPQFKPGETEDEERDEKIAEMQEYLSTIQNPQILHAIMQYFHDMHNILEDGYVNNRIVERFPGYGKHLKAVLSEMFDDMPTLTELKQREGDAEEELKDIMKYTSIATLIHCYALFAEVKCESWEYTNERIVILDELMDDIDAAVLCYSAEERTKLQNGIIAKVFPYLKPVIDRYLDIYGNEPGSNNDSLEEEIGSALASMPHSSAMPTNVSSSPNTKVEEENTTTASTTSFNSSNDDETDDEEPEDKSEENENGTTIPSYENTDDENSEDEDSKNENSSAKLENEKSDSNNDSENGEIEKRDGSEDNPINTTEHSEGQRERAIDKKSVMDTIQPKERRKSLLEHEESESRGYEKAATDIQRILNNMATEEVNAEKERERTEELNDFAASIDHQEIHDGCTCTVKRISRVDDVMKNQYDQVAPDLLKISRRIKEKFQKIIAKKQKGQKFSNLYIGKRLEARTLVRGDGKYFSKKTLPTNKPTLCVGLLIDESGSMSCSDRITYARAAAITLYDFCSSLKIPIGVFGHQSSCGRVVINDYAEFQSIDKDDKYRLMDISAGSSNRDGYALRYVVERMAKIEADIKLLIVISDGQPADSGYYGAGACEDIAWVVKNAKKRQIITIAAAIGDDKDTIESIYRDNFLDISNLEDLPMKLTNLVKKYIK